ncbi:hypothetical protein [Novosphingobium sp. Rr 2-17]|uniref:hypothetical protein n=1 Tax=Novosphingobium sp. Rr 2-17 TaxID=555793 RepID=UPI001ED97DF3|nr:hypothetical protein [Novosphingobium sp. Rr 2-17]
MLMASACSTAPQTSRTGRVSAALLAPPPELPKVQRDSAGQMTGAQALPSLTAVYDVAGQIRAAYIELQAEVRLALGIDDAQSR